mmetsp:Transcript_106246/g.298818  ORF Transcript_106246/g.298818 Transcript_106246/m.298818 type:complete len:348 (-) Transcript_106246:394-1437(-)
MLKGGIFLVRYPIPLVFHAFLHDCWVPRATPLHQNLLPDVWLKTCIIPLVTFPLLRSTFRAIQARTRHSILRITTQLHLALDLIEPISLGVPHVDQLCTGDGRTAKVEVCRSGAQCFGHTNHSLPGSRCGLPATFATPRLRCLEQRHMWCEASTFTAVRRLAGNVNDWFGLRRPITASFSLLLALLRRNRLIAVVFFLIPRRRNLIHVLPGVTLCIPLCLSHSHLLRVLVNCTLCVLFVQHFQALLHERTHNLFANRSNQIRWSHLNKKNAIMGKVAQATEPEIQRHRSFSVGVRPSSRCSCHGGFRCLSLACLHPRDKQSNVCLFRWYTCLGKRWVMTDKVILYSI